jgi:hypothetical protein
MKFYFQRERERAIIEQKIITHMDENNNNNANWKQV